MNELLQFETFTTAYVQGLPVNLSFVPSDNRRRTGRMVVVSHFYRLLRPLDRAQQRVCLNVSHKFNNNNNDNIIPPELNPDNVYGADDNDREEDNDGSAILSAE